MEKERLHPVFHRMPGDWGIARIDQAFSIQQGKQVSARNRDGQRQRPFLRTKNVYWGRLDLTELDKMHFSAEDEKRLQLLPGDLLTCEGGWVGRTAMWNGEAANCLYQNHLHRLRRISAETNSQFALYWLWYAFEIGNVYFGRQNVTTIPNLSKSRLGELPMPLPKPNEQRQIAAVLSAVQRAIERQERLIALTAELKKALMHKLFTEGTRGEKLKETEIGRMPESWELLRLVDLLREPLRNGHSAKETPDPAGIRTLTLTAVTRDDFSIANTKTTVADVGKVKDLWLRDGDIYIQRANTLDYVGLAALYEGPQNFAIFPDLLVRIRVREEKMLPKVLCEYLVSHRCRRYFQMNAKGTAGNFPKIDQGIIESLQIPLPRPEEQVEIERIARTLDKKYATHIMLRTRLKGLFRTLLHQLMTAQIRVQDLNLSALDETLSAPAGAA